MKAREYYLTRILFDVLFLLVVVVGIATQGDWNDPSTLIYFLILTGAVGIVLAWDAWDYFHSRPDQQYGLRDRDIRAWAAQGSRKLPGILLAVSVIGAVGLWIELNSGHRSWVLYYLVAPLGGLIGLAGVLHPPLYYALWPAIRTHGGTRALAYAIAGVGLLIGVYWAWFVQGR